ncbi:MAG: nickel pincer cofactor biosynthesis protein LarC [Oligoflexia bacterium]|nr:nickel pincer cofactor biosynthesis protein LarC [Oligoflexia bacterium]
MFLGALIDLGILPENFMQKLILLFDTISPTSSTSPISTSCTTTPHSIEAKKIIKKGIACTSFTLCDKKHNTHHHRSLTDINCIIDNCIIDDSDLQLHISPRAQKLAKKIFLHIAQAEAKIHNQSIETIHFHEVGAVDSIIDILGAAMAIDYLMENCGVSKIVASPVNLGSGFVECEHGILPVPAPATLEILQGLPVYSSGISKELTTPTGAAIIRTLVTEFGQLPPMAIEKIGYGSGKRDLEIPNVLRIILGAPSQTLNITSTGHHADHHYSSQLLILETNIDDMSGEIYSYLFDQLLTAGALDVFVTPIIMKKNRPANQLSVLCNENHATRLLEIIFAETTTLGVRKYWVERSELPRKEIKVSTDHGEVTVKIALINDRIAKYSPSYQECATLAAANNIPLRTIYQQAEQLARTFEGTSIR